MRRKMQDWNRINQRSDDKKEDEERRREKR